MHTFISFAQLKCVNIYLHGLYTVCNLPYQVPSNGRKGKPLFVLIIMETLSKSIDEQQNFVHKSVLMIKGKKSHIKYSKQGGMCVRDDDDDDEPITNNTVCSVKSFNVDIYLLLVAIAGLTGCLHNKYTHVYVTVFFRLSLFQSFTAYVIYIVLTGASVSCI